MYVCDVLGPLEAAQVEYALGELGFRLLELAHRDIHTTLQCIKGVMDCHELSWIIGII